MTRLSISFHGGVGTVTGSNFLVSGSSQRFLVDCGMFQGGAFCDRDNYKPFPYDPRSIDALIVTHAHIDHIGRIPKLTKEGFSGVIYGTDATRDLAAHMLEDCLAVFDHERKKNDLPPLYEKKDIEKALSLWHPVPYHRATDLGGGISFSLKDAGHILGSAMIDVAVNGTHLVFTGDLGNSPSPLIRDAEVVEDATYLVIESVYGDRVHEPPEERLGHLEDVIEEAVRRGGTLLIPAFSLERTQVLLYEINRLVEGDKVPSVPVFVDSPLAIRLTDVYRKYTNYFNDEVREEMRAGDDVFRFSKLKFTESIEESRAIALVKGPKIIIAGAGMSHGGRIIEHEKRYLPDGRNTVLIVGYQAAGSVGRQLQEGANNVVLHGERVRVAAKIHAMTGYSGHRDVNGLMQFVSTTADALKRVFVVGGEARSSLFLVQRLRDYLGADALLPAVGKEYPLDF